MSHPEADVPHALPPARALIYANHAGTSWPKPPGVAEAMLDALEASPVDTGDIYADAHSTIATFFGLPSPSRLVLTTSCTGALQVAINDLKFAAGDIVITSGFEHHALSRAVSRLAWDRGIEHVVCPPDEISDEGTGGGPLDLDFLEKALEAGEGKVRLVAITGASNVTGEVMPIERVVELAHAKGALVLLDAAQVAGLIPLHVAELGVDIFVLAGHKAALGPLGIGAFWAAPHVTFVCPAATCEMASKVGSGGIGPSTFPSFCDVGSVNLPAADLNLTLCSGGPGGIPALAGVPGPRGHGGARLRARRAPPLRPPLAPRSHPPRERPRPPHRDGGVPGRGSPPPRGGALLPLAGHRGAGR
mmetsp:Transcript_31860/g.101497  ORF Transcript_31860/g.101497 Transcript_31860/m.101497 type:complete len:361 (+) Transcript_31860:3-1085(+)